MSDYLVGRKAQGGKDRYMVGWNESKSNANAYRVGSGGSQVAQSDNKSLGGGQMDPVVGSKSAFGYAGELDPKSVGDKSDNMNFGGEISNGIQQNSGAEVAGNLAYTEKGDWNTSKDAIARRKANADAAKRYYSANGEYNSPVPQVDAPKK